MPTVHLQYFAQLREQRGRDSETVNTGSATAGGLFDELRKRHGFTLAAGDLRVAVNDEFTEWDAALNEGDHVVFIPPVAGG
jgi:molybdopterin converting factor subunit 1